MAAHLMHLAERRERWRHEGLCRACGSEVVEGLLVCEYHRDYQREFQRDLRSARKAAGLCLRCGARALKGRSLCAKHRQEAKLLDKARRQKDAAKRREVERKKAWHLANQDRVAVARDAYAQRRRDAGLCTHCGWPLPAERRGMWICEDCTANHVERETEKAAERRAAGLCVCGRRPARGYARCARCRKYSRTLAAEDRARRKGQGICRSCSQSIARDRSTTFCLAHLEAHVATARRVRRRAKGIVIK